ncbi:putative aminopeptidase YsdC [Geobacillus sp. BCO2]|nr:putative aminopeptidase YsdC [Geobacillus sp. BCO2]
MNEDTLQLFQTLTELPGAPGYEHPVRQFMRQELAKYADDIVQDRLGSLFGVKRGEEAGPTVMVAGHMDEVAFMVTAITDNGMIRFQPLGGWWDQVLLAQRVQIMTNEGPIIGVIGSIPPHLLDEEQRKKPMEIKNMLIDIGAESREDAERVGIRPGQPIVPVSPFTVLANGKTVMAKAWDNRFGCGLAIELLKELNGETVPNVLYAGATVQEEVGLRGAQTAAAMINPISFLPWKPAQRMTCPATSRRSAISAKGRSSACTTGRWLRTAACANLCLIRRKRLAFRTSFSFPQAAEPTPGGCISPTAVFRRR